MFNGASSFNSDISSWNISNVTVASSMFNNATSFNQDISVWNVGKVINMANMFNNAIAFNQNLSNWNISNVTNMTGMLNGTAISIANYDAILEGWATLTTGETKIPTNVSLGAGGLFYTTAGQVFRTSLDITRAWTITGDALVGAPLIPVITNFTPTSGAVGTSVIINGANFSTTPANNIVAFNGTTAVVTASTATSITTSVPTGATTGKISVTVAGNSATSASDFTVIQPPTITSFTPLSGTVGTTVTITGTNFSTTPANNVAAFNGTTAVVTASTATSITTSVPTGATTGRISVIVAGNTATSANDFTVTTSGGEVTITPETLETNIGGIVSLNLVSLITTLNNNLDINSITVSVPPPSGALAEVVDGVLTVDYTNVSFSGRENVTIRACDTDANCATQLFEIEVIGKIEVYNGISPNNDLQNEKFIIQYIDVLPETQNNKVSIFNRWGDVVWEGVNYNNQTVVFTGKNKNGQELPSGTYFYKIQFSSGRKSETGYLVIKK
jgi:gliding motility-associated-like protein